jgi:integrase
MDRAIANHAIDDNLVRFVRRRKQQLPFPDPWSPDEVEALVDHMTRAYPVAIANLAEFKFFTGIRPSEDAALRWSEVVMVAQRAHVQGAIVQGQAKAATQTNTARTVLPNGRAPAAVMRRRTVSQLACDFVFGDPRCGTPWSCPSAWCKSTAPMSKTLRKARQRTMTPRRAALRAGLSCGCTVRALIWPSRCPRYRAPPRAAPAAARAARG